MTSQQTQAEQNKAVVRRFVEAGNRVNLSAYDELLADNFVDHSAPPGFPNDREGQKQFTAMLIAAFPEGSQTADDLISEDDKVVMRWTGRGTHKGEFMGNYAVWRQPLNFLEQGKLRLMGDGSAPFPLIYADDIGRFILALFDKGEAGGSDGIQILANPQPTTLRMVFDVIADAVKQPRAGSVPLWIARAGAGVVSALPRVFRRGRLDMLTHARVLQFSRGYDLSAVLDRALMERVGLTDYQEGLRRMLADYLAVRK